MRYGWAAAFAILVTTAHASPPKPAPPNLRSGEEKTIRKPAAADIPGLLGLDPAHDVFAPRSQRDDVVHWTRMHDGIAVPMFDVVTVPLVGGWSVRYRAELAHPPDVKRSALIGVPKAIAKAGLANATAELEYFTVFADLQRPGTPGTNAVDFVSVVQQFDVVYRVHPLGRQFPSVYIDAYSGAERLRNTGIID